MGCVFHLGDRVRHWTTVNCGFGTVAFVRADGHVQVEWDDGWSSWEAEGELELELERESVAA